MERTSDVRVTVVQAEGEETYFAHATCIGGNRVGVSAESGPWGSDLLALAVCFARLSEALTRKGDKP